MRFRDFRRIDRRPGEATDVPRRVHVCVVGVSTGHAAKLCLRWAVGFGYMPANRARLAGVRRRNQHDIHAMEPCLVLDERAQLTKSPSAYPRPLCLVNYPRLKPGACPWRYAIRRVSETFGGLTAARRPILIAAMWSANPAYPQATQEKVL